MDKVPDGKGMQGEGRRLDWREQLNCTSEEKGGMKKAAGEFRRPVGKK